MGALRRPPPVRMTLDEFLVWDPGEPTVKHWQLIDGEPVAMAPASDRHGTIQAEIGAILRNHLLATSRPCRVVTAPGVIPRVRANKNCRIPDLGVTCAPPGDGIQMPDPVLLIEILSPSNETETQANVWTYTTIPSVREILLGHVSRHEAELLRKRDDGTWPADADLVLAGQDIMLDSIGPRVPLSPFYRTSGRPR